MQAALGQPFLNGNLDGGIKGGSGIPWVTLLGIAPALPAGAWTKDQMEGLPPAKPTHLHNLSLPIPRPDYYHLANPVIYNVCQRYGMLTRLHLLKFRLIKS